LPDRISTVAAVLTFYLVADNTHGVDPVASFVVKRQNTGLQSVVPQPYVNTR
jgi:hypothetical protein